MRITEFPDNKVVFTTKSIAKGNAPIFYVSLDNDGDLQMFGEEEQDVNNAMLVSLEQMLEKDETLLQLPDFEKGVAYVREGKESEWKIFE